MMVEVEITWTTREYVFLPPDTQADGSPYVNMGLANEFAPDQATAVDITVIAVGD